MNRVTTDEPPSLALRITIGQHGRPSRIRARAAGRPYLTRRVFLARRSLRLRVTILYSLADASGWDAPALGNGAGFPGRPSLTLRVMMCSPLLTLRGPLGEASLTLRTFRSGALLD